VSKGACLFSKKIQEILYRIYDGLPSEVREVLRPVVRGFFLLKRVFIFASQLRLPICLLQGKEKWGCGSLTTLFFGDERGTFYLSHLLYSGEPIKESLGKIFIWGIKSRLNLGLPRADLIFIKMDGFFSRFLSRQGFIIIPGWVLFMLDLSKSLPEVWKLSKNDALHANLRKIRKHSYSYEMTRDPSKFKYFYDQMYLPYITKRFEKLTVLIGFRDMERTLEKGQLILIKKGNDYVSGCVIKMDSDTVVNLYLGITEGRVEYLKAGALAALYYFMTLWAKEEGYKWLDFGHCRSFFKDGVFNHKKQWGMGIKISTRLRPVFGMKVCNFHHGVENFLEKNPFIFMDQGKLKGLILVEQDHPPTLEEVQSLVRTYSIPGLDCMVILSDQGFTRQAEEFANSCSTQRLQLIGSKTDVFFEAFPHVLHLEKRNS